jgi:tetratricopeptide (TPR) repeat protein
VLIVLLVAIGCTFPQIQKVSTTVQPSPVAMQQHREVVQVADQREAAPSTPVATATPTGTSTEQAFDGVEGADKRAAIGSLAVVTATASETGTAQAFAGEEMELSADPEAQQDFEMGMEAYHKTQEQLKDPVFGPSLATNSAKIAYQSFSQAIYRDPQRAAAYFYRAVVASILGHSQDDQLSDLDQAIKLKPDFARAWFERAALLMHMNQGEEGWASLDRAIALKPDYYEALIARAWGYYKGWQNWEKALEDFNRAEAVIPPAMNPLGIWKLYVGRCFVLYALKRYDAALPDCNQAIALRPDDAEAYVTLGSLYQETGKVKEMIANYTKAMTLNSRFRQIMQADPSEFKKMLVTLKPDSEEYTLLADFIDSLDTATQANS